MDTSRDRDRVRVRSSLILEEVVGETELGVSVDFCEVAHVKHIGELLDKRAHIHVCHDVEDREGGWLIMQPSRRAEEQRAQPVCDCHASGRHVPEQLN